jgi:oligoribonuclease NrnB/cAMP/cGMP phosphodiesterase (DHH superfamily)
MRIVTRADFDGVVCAVLLHDAEEIDEPVKWVEPNDMQKGKVAVKKGDIVANLPYHPQCSLWFDHHFTNQQVTDFKGAFKMAPSAAGVIFDYYQGAFERDYTELVRQADKIDAADLSQEEVRRPESNPYILLSMTISSNTPSDEPYWNRLVDLLRKADIEETMADPEVRERCREVVQRNNAYEQHLMDHTRVEGVVAVTDFRSFDAAPTGNRFLVYSLFPDAVVHVRIRYAGQEPDKVIVNVGHSIFNRNCHVNVGLLLSRYGGGGHAGAGSCTLERKNAEPAIADIVETLKKNEPIDR